LDVDMGYKDWDFGSNTYGEFDGDGDYVDCGALSSMQSYSNYAVSFWIYINNIEGAFDYVFQLKDNSGNTGNSIWMYPDGDVGCCEPVGGEGYDVWNINSVTTGSWHHVVFMSQEENNGTVYVDGLNKGNMTNLETRFPFNDVIFGGSNRSIDFNGSIDEVRIYNRSLTASEILEINQSGRIANNSINSTGLVGYWDFDEDGYVGDGECYDNETEILTDEGWKLFSELDRNEKVMTLNQETGQEEWQLPKDWQVFDNSKLGGEMYKIETEYWDCDDGLDYIDNLQDERYDGVVSSDDESSSQSKQTSNEGILVSDNNNPQNCVKKTGGLVVSEKHKVFSNKRKEESIGIVMMSEEEKDDSFSLLIDSEFEDKTLHNMNTPLTSEVISQGFVVMGSEDDFINFVVKNLSEDRIFSSSLVNLFFTGRHEVRSVNHFESNFLKNSSTDLYLIGVSSLNLLFISSTCSGLGGSSSTGCQSICSQNSQSSSVTSRVSLYLLDMSCFKSLTTALDKNSMPNDLDLSSCILTDNLGNQDYLSFVVDDFSLQPITEVYSDFNNGKDVWFMGSEGELIEIKNIEKIDYSGMIYDVDVENDIVLVRRKNDDSTTQINIDNVILDKLGGLESSQAKDDNYLSNNLSDINKLAEQCDEVHCEAEEGEGDYLVVWSGNSVADKSGLGNDGVKYGNVSYGSDNLNSSLVGYWHFDNLSSAGENDTLVYDWSGNGNNGTVVGGTDVDSGWTSSGVYNGAQMFDGVGDWVDVGDMDNSLFSSDFAISVWVYHNADNSDFIWGKGTANNVNAELFVRGGSGYEFRIDQDTGADIDTGNAVPITTWQHVVVNRNVSNLSIYVDAVIKDSATNSEDGSSTSSFLIGDSSGSPGVIEWDGLIDEVMIFNRSLSAEQIKQLYVKGRAKFEYKPYQEMDDDYFPVDQTNTNFLVGYKFNAGNNTNPFYSPLLMTTTGSPITIYSNDTIAFCGEALGIAGKTYYLDQNILDNSLTSDCITITAENVTLDCQGYSISSDDAYSGVYSNQFNTTIKNCNISMGTSDGGYGIEFTDSADNSSILHNVLGNQYYGLNFASGSNGPDYCVIYNNTANVSCASCIGIYLYNSNNNNLTDNIGISDSSTGGFVRSDYSNLVNNIWISNSSYGIYIDGSYNNLVNNTGTSSSEEGFFIYTVDYSNLTNNKGESDSDYGFYLENSDYNVLNGSIGISNSNNGVYIRGSQHNTFINTNASGAYGFYIRTSANNTIQDCINISGSTKDVYVLSDAGSTNNTFLNCSYDSESVNGAGNELIRKWWYQSYVNDTDGNDVANAKLYYFNTTGNYNGKFTTNSTGGTGKQSLIEYVNTGGTRTYYNNHTLRAVHNNYLQNVTSYNVSLELNNLIHNFELVNDTVVPLIEFVSPTLANNTATTNRSFELNISITEDNLRELIYNWNGTNTSLYNDSLVLMMNFDNVGALGEYDGFVRDLSGNDNDGIVTGAVVNTSGKYGGAYEFDGDGDYVDLGDKDVWNINNVTISAWIKLNDVSGRRDTIIHNYISANPKDYWGIRMDTNDKLLWHMRDSSGVAKLLWSNMTLNANQWYHVVATRDTSTAKIQLYFDSSFNNETSISGQSDLIEGHNGPTVIGSFAGSIPADSYFNGTIDSVLIFNRSLSADEISQLYMSNLNKYDHTKWALWVNQTKNSTDVLDDAKYTTLASALDFNTLLNMTDIRTLIVDNVNPDISITYPSNNTNWSNIGLNINYTASDSGGGLDSCWYSNDSMSVNVSLANCSTNITNVVWTEGWHNVTVWVNDSAGNENKSSVSFRIDTTIPNITLLTPANSVSSTTNSYNFTFNVSDASVVSNCSLIVDGNTINMLYNVSKEVAVGMYNSSFSIARHTWRVNCTDEANNIGNSSQRIFTVTRAVVEEVVSSGGGGSLAEEVPATVGERRFKVDEESINVRIVLDEIKTREFKLTNLEDYGIDVEISVEELDDLIIINDRVSLEKDEKKTVKFKVISPEELGIRTGKIILSYKDVRKEILISINPQSKETLFDVSVNLAEDKLEKQDNLKTQLNLLPVGEKGIDVTVKYIIKDFKGEIYYEESETFYVDAPISVSKEFAIDRLNHGDYILGVEMSYLGGFASASQLFEVKGKFPIKEVNFIIILAGLVIIIILIILGMTMWKTKRYKRNKKHLKIRKRRR